MSYVGYINAKIDNMHGRQNKEQEYSYDLMEPFSNKMPNVITGNSIFTLGLTGIDY